MNSITTESCLQTLSKDQTNNILHWPMLRLANEKFLRRVDKFFVVKDTCNALVVMRDKPRCYVLGSDLYYLFGGFDIYGNGPIELLELQGKTVVQCAGGIKYMMVLTNDGELYTWGAFTSPFVHPRRVVIRDNPLVMTNVTMVACGDFHTAALRQDGTVWCWGNNWFGQLGLAKDESFTRTRTETDVHVPKMVDALRGKRVVQIGGTDINCAALTDQSEIYVWGQFRGGQIFHPYQIPLPQDLTVVSITVGGADLVTLSPDGTARLCYFKPINPDEDEESMYDDDYGDNDLIENKEVFRQIDPVTYDDSYHKKYEPCFKVLAELNEQVQAVASVQWSYCFKLASGRVALYYDHVFHTEGTSMADALALNQTPMTAGLTTLSPKAVSNLSNIPYFHNPSISNFDCWCEDEKRIYLNKKIVSKLLPKFCVLFDEGKSWRKVDFECNISTYSYVSVFALLSYAHTGTVGEIVPRRAGELLELAMKTNTGPLRDHCLHSITHTTNGTRMLVESKRWPKVIRYLDQNLTLANSIYFFQLAEEACDEPLKERISNFTCQQSKLTAQ